MMMMIIIIMMIRSNYQHKLLSET